MGVIFEDEGSGGRVRRRERFSREGRWVRGRHESGSRWVQFQNVLPAKIVLWVDLVWVPHRIFSVPVRTRCSSTETERRFNYMRR